MTDYTELGRRIVRIPSFRWIAGMRWRFDAESHRNIWSRYSGSDECDDDGNPVIEASPFVRTQDKRIIIDLSDPATVGCLLWLYDQTRTMLAVPDPVYTLVAAYGLMHEKTLDEIIKRLEGDA